jgi:VWFA-related protein
LRIPWSILCAQILPFAFAVFLCAQPAFPAGFRGQPGAAAAPSVDERNDPPRPASDAAEGRIRLDVAVTDKAGKPVTGLNRSDFTLLDNGQSSAIVSFSAFDAADSRPVPPVQIILVIDTINHKAHQVPDVQPDVIKFLRQDGGHLAQPVSVYRVTERGLFVTPQPSTDGNELADELSHQTRLHEVPLEKTGFSFQNSSFQNQSLDLQTALGALGSIVLIERRKPGRKLLVWVGYGGIVGEDSFDWITEFSTRIREARITLSSVTLWQDSANHTKANTRWAYELFLSAVKSASQAIAGNLALEVLAAQSGGSVSEDTSDMARMIDKCVEDASAFYTVTFNPPQTDHPDEYHDLKIEVAKPGLVAHTSTGYYDQPVYYDQPYLPAARITVDQLQQLLGNSHAAPDADTARQLSTMELTERLSTSRLASWKPRLPGPKSWASLVVLADASAFLNPPPAEISANPPPDTAAQQQMQSKMIDYLQGTIPKLPDFFAARTTDHYEEPSRKDGQSWKTASGDGPLHLAGSSQATVIYRNGYEAVESVKGRKLEKEKKSLSAKGIFGPILGAVILTAVRSNLIWSRWEQIADGPRAVFRYSVLKKDPVFELTYCCLLNDGAGSGTFQDFPGYHGEIEIDPDSGAVLRMTIEADLESNLHPNLPIFLSRIVVEYGPVDIGGTSHICLLKSIAILRERTIFELHEWNESFKIYAPFETMLEDSTFSRYHMFSGQARVLSGYSDAPDDKSPDPNSNRVPDATPTKPQ